MENDNDPNGLGLPPLAPLETDSAEDTPPSPPPRKTRSRRSQVSAPDGLHDQTEEDEKIARLLEDDENSGAVIEVGRRTQNNKWAFCCAVPVADWNSDSKVQIANEFGGGYYRATIKRSDKTIASNFTFEIDSLVKPKAQAPAAPAFDMQQLVAQLKPADQSGGMMQMFQAQQTMMMQFMQMQAQQSAENMKALVAVMARPVAQAPATNDRIVEVLLAKALDKPAMDLPKVIEAVAKLRTVANGGDVDDDDGEEKGDDIFGSVMKALPGLVTLIGQGAASGTRQIAAPAPNPPQRRVVVKQKPAETPAMPATAPTPDPEPEPEPEESPRVEVNKDVLAIFLPQVVALAEQSQTPEQAAAAIREALPEGQVEVLSALLRQEKWLDVLIDAHRPVMKWTKWFAALREILVAEPAPVAQEVEVVNP